MVPGSISCQVSKPFPKGQILDTSKLKEFTDDTFRFDGNGRKFSKLVENNVGKGEVAGFEQFSFSHCVSKRLVLQTCKNQGLFGKGLTCIYKAKRGKPCQNWTGLRCHNYDVVVGFLRLLVRKIWHTLGPIHLRFFAQTVQGHFLGRTLLLGIRTFSFSHNVFHSYISLVRLNGALRGNGLMGLNW